MVQSPKKIFFGPQFGLKIRGGGGGGRGPPLDSPLVAHDQFRIEEYLWRSVWRICRWILGLKG